jgi:CheY-like chemotaxis protein
MEKILIIEDDAFMARMYVKIFALEDFQVELASNGEEGLIKARQLKPAVVLLDIMMPKMNGFQVLEAMKTDPETKDIPVIMLTNLAGDQDIEEAMQKGAAKYVVKSNYTPRQIIEMVKKVIAGKMVAQSPEPTSL